MNGIIKEKVYIEQLLGFEDYEFPNHVYKLNKALYGLKQSPRAWYERLSKFLIDNEFTHGKVDTTLFLKKKDKNLLVVQIYIDDIILGGTMHFFVKNLQNSYKENSKWVWWRNLISSLDFKSNKKRKKFLLIKPNTLGKLLKGLI